MAELIIYEELDHKNSRPFDLVMPRLLIGSSPDNELVLANSQLAPAHASLEMRYSYWVLQDLGSEPKTLVNGTIINEPYVLEHEDVIEIGPVKLEFRNEPVQATNADTHPTVPIPVIATESPLGRVWLVKVMVATLLIIMVIIFLSIYFELIQPSDLPSFNFTPNTPHYLAMLAHKWNEW